MAKTKKQQMAELLDNESLEMKNLADKAENIIRKHLYKWLSTGSQHKVENFLRFYHQEDRLELLDAMMAYAVTGKKRRLERAVAQWHFRLFCEMLDDDRYTVPSHTLLVRLWKKVGLFQSVTLERAGEGPGKEEIIRPFDQEW